jgi:hypothetical protein
MVPTQKRYTTGVIASNEKRGWKRSILNLLTHHGGPAKARSLSGEQMPWLRKKHPRMQWSIVMVSIITTTTITVMQNPVQARLIKPLPLSMHHRIDGGLAMIGGRGIRYGLDFVLPLLRLASNNFPVSEASGCFIGDLSDFVAGNVSCLVDCT